MAKTLEEVITETKPVLINLADVWRYVRSKEKPTTYDLFEGLYKVPVIEAIPKDQYEARLKADMIATLKRIRNKIYEFSKAESDPIFAEGELFCSDLIQAEIVTLEGNKDGES